MFSCDQDEVLEEGEAIDLNEEIPINYEGWHCGHMGEEESEPISPQELVHSTPPVLDATMPAPIQQQKPCETPILEHGTKSKATLSQILAIPRFVSTKARKRTNALYSHNKLITSESFALEIKEKEDKAEALKLALLEKRKAKQEKAHRKKQEKEGKRIDNMVKKWIKQMEKKAEYTD